MHVGKVITIETPVGCHRDKSPSCVSFPYILFVLSKVTSLFLLLSFISFFFFMGGRGEGKGVGDVREAVSIILLISPTSTAKRSACCIATNDNLCNYSTHLLEEY